MSTSLQIPSASEAGFCGVRMTADEFLELPEDGCNYELIDGVVIVSPSPKPPHQSIAGEIFRQLANYLESSPVGEALSETDVYLGKGPTGGDLVYRPELVFVERKQLPEITERISGPPALAVEVISRGSRRLDTRTKRDDYERFGVKEYWLVDPQQRTITFYRLEGGRFVEAPPEGDRYTSQAVPGFILDLTKVRKRFEPWTKERS